MPAGLITLGVAALTFIILKIVCCSLECFYHNRKSKDVESGSTAADSDPAPRYSALVSTSSLYRHEHNRHGDYALDSTSSGQRMRDRIYVLLFQSEKSRGDSSCAPPPTYDEALRQQAADNCPWTLMTCFFSVSLRLQCVDWVLLKSQPNALRYVIFDSVDLLSPALAVDYYYLLCIPFRFWLKFLC